MSDSRTALGWGVGLVVLGLVLLLRTFEVVGPTSAWPWAMLAAGVTLLVHPRSRRASTLVAPLLLIIIGGLFAVRDLGVLPGGVPVVPVLLIVAGVALLASHVGRDTAGTDPEPIEVPLEDAAGGRLVLAHGAGTLRVAGGAQPGLLCEGTVRGGGELDRRRIGDRLEVTLRQRTDFDRLLRTRRSLDWDLRLTSEHPTALEVRTGASQVYLDLTQTAVESLSVKTGASDVEVWLPAGRSCRVEVDAGAAEVDVWVPADVSADVQVRSALASVDVDPRRFPRHGQGYRSPGFDTAEHRAEIDIEGGVASFTVR